MRNFSNQNLVVALGQLLGWFACIQAFHFVTNWPGRLAIMIFFCLMMQGVFSLMHDCIHGLGHHNPRVNLWVGWVTGVIFGTTYSLYRVNHQGHHVRNRTPAEIAEYILPGESRLRKTVVYYFAILGGIWLGSFVAVILFPFVPYRFVRFLNKPGKSMNGYSLSFANFTERSWTRLRLECLVSIGFWVFSIWLFSWSFAPLLILYAAFGFSYSSLQWIYHLRTPLDPVEGAYNLRSWTPVRWLFLNFNYNLTHHRHPELHWQQLHAHTDLRETQPSWFRYLLVFLPPERMPADPSTIRKTYF